jgi:hypothetical protein
VDIAHYEELFLCGKQQRRKQKDQKNKVFHVSSLDEFMLFVEFIGNIWFQTVFTNVTNHNTISVSIPI